MSRVDPVDMPNSDLSQFRPQRLNSDQSGNESRGSGLDKKDSAIDSIKQIMLGSHPSDCERSGMERRGMIDKAASVGSASPIDSGSKISEAGKSLLSGAIGQTLANQFGAEGKADPLTPDQAQAVDEAAAKSLLGKSSQQIDQGLKDVAANAGNLTKEIADYQTKGSPISADTKDILNKTADSFDAAGRPDLANLVRETFAGAQVSNGGGADKPVSDTDRLLAGELATSLFGKDKVPSAQDLGLNGKAADDYTAARDGLKIGRPATDDETRQVLEAANRVGSGMATADDAKGMKLASDVLRKSGDPAAQANADILDQLVAAANPAANTTKTAGSGNAGDKEAADDTDATSKAQDAPADQNNSQPQMAGMRPQPASIGDFKPLSADQLKQMPRVATPEALNTKISSKPELINYINKVEKEFGLPKNWLVAQLNKESSLLDPSQSLDQLRSRVGDADRGSNASYGIGQISKDFFGNGKWASDGPGLWGEKLDFNQYSNSLPLQVRTAAAMMNANAMLSQTERGQGTSLDPLVSAASKYVDGQFGNSSVKSQNYIQEIMAKAAELNA
jgi:hypothetical protein